MSFWIQIDSPRQFGETFPNAPTTCNHEPMTTSQIDPERLDWYRRASAVMQPATPFDVMLLSVLATVATFTDGRFSVRGADLLVAINSDEMHRQAAELVKAAAE